MEGQLLQQAVLYNNAELLSSLLEGPHQGHVNVTDQRNRTPLFTAVSNLSFDCCRLLLEADADPNIKSGLECEYMTPLHIVVEKQNESLISLLLHHGADINAENIHGQTPLTLAMAAGTTNVIKLLQEEIDIRQIRDQSLESSFLEAVDDGNVVEARKTLSMLSESSITATLLSLSARVETHPLYQACQSGHTEMVELLFELDCLDWIDPETLSTPLHAATLFDHTAIMKLLLQRCPEWAQMPNSDGQLPIHVAVQSNHFSATELLLSFDYPSHVLGFYCHNDLFYRFGFTLNARNSRGQTVLHIAAAEGAPDTLKLLLSLRVEARSRQRLISNGSRDSLDAFEESWDKECESMLICPFQLSGEDLDDHSPLDLAVANEHVVASKLLVDLGVCPSSSLLKLAVQLKNSQLLEVLLVVSDCPRSLAQIAVEHQDWSSLLVFLRQYSVPDVDIQVKHSTNSVNVPVALLWNNLQLEFVKFAWMLLGVKHLNPKLEEQDLLRCLTQIDLSQNQLNHFPDEVWNLTSMHRLNISYNSISCVNFEKSLQSALSLVNLSHNILLSVPEGLFTLPQLRILNLSNNNLANLPMTMWSSSVQELDLSHNHLIQLPVASHHVMIAHMSPMHNSATASSSLDGAKVEHAARWRHQLQIDDHHVLSAQDSFSCLQELNLQNNELSKVPLMLACICPRLLKLDLSYNNIDEYVHVSSLPICLTWLNLAHNKLSSTDPSTVTPCSLETHTQLPSLKTLNLSHNSLTKVTLQEDNDLLYPSISHLNLGNNLLNDLPPEISQCSQLTELKLADNKITELSPDLGLLRKLWNLDLTQCPVEKSFQSILGENSRKTAAIIGYLKSVKEKAVSFNQIKLMFVGVQGIGKTSLLGELRRLTAEKSIPKHWAQRMGHHVKGKDQHGENISTVGIDIGCLSMTRAGRSVVFRTWDFGGQREYYATHQYFLSSRAIYLVIWNLTEGEKGLRQIQEWLITIQGRAPGSPVIIVGTHLDQINKKKYTSDYLHKLQVTLRQLYMSTTEPEKSGLPRVLGHVEVSCRGRSQGIHRLMEVLYEVAICEPMPGNRNVRLLDQKIPAIYLQLQQAVAVISNKCHEENRLPVLHTSMYRQLVEDHMSAMFDTSFRDLSELNQATQFLHENGVLLHYEDTNLSDVYFLDPQWLCDMLAHVVGVRQVNSLAPHGVMRVAELQLLFRSVGAQAVTLQQYMIELLSKFEVALKWNKEFLLIPSLLPPNPNHNLPCGSCTSSTASPEIVVQSQSNHTAWLLRLYIMSYFPSGFWPRLITRLLGDASLQELALQLYDFPQCLTQNGPLRPEWRCWQNGAELVVLNAPVVRVQQASMQNSSFTSTDYTKCKLLIQAEGYFEWSCIEVNNFLEIWLPNEAITVSGCSDELIAHYRVLAALLAAIVDQVDTLLEDWFPDLGTRFVQNTFGAYLIERLVPCPHCLANCPVDSKNSFAMVEVAEEVPHLSQSVCISGHGKFSIRPELTGSAPSLANLFSRSDHHETEERETSFPSQSQKTEDSCIVYCIQIEQCMLAAQCNRVVACPQHGNLGPIFVCDSAGQMTPRHVAPDACFHDLPTSLLVSGRFIQLDKFLGQGAFGAVFSGSIECVGKGEVRAAIKMLHPVNPGALTTDAQKAEHRIKKSEWDKDILKNSCEAYMKVRTELSVLLRISHERLVSVHGVALQPLCLLLSLAPLGSLHDQLSRYLKEGVYLTGRTVHMILLQVISALTYLHQNQIIYRDLKSDNVLVWELPSPNQLTGNVSVKLADYGVSRCLLSSGMKGLAGTVPFMAPEIFQHNGEEAYTEKVDIFSFGMFMHEIICRKIPFEDFKPTAANLRSHILSGHRPPLGKKDLCYPLSMLDLMTECWKRDSSQRPSSGEIGAILNRAGFSELYEAVCIGGECVLAACVIAVPPAICLSVLSTEYSSLNSSRLLLYSLDGFFCHSLTISTSIDSRVVSLASDNDVVYAADLSSRISLLDIHDLQLLQSTKFDLDKNVYIKTMQVLSSENLLLKLSNEKLVFANICTKCQQCIQVMATCHTFIQGSVEIWCGTQDSQIQIFSSEDAAPISWFSLPTNNRHSITKISSHGGRAWTLAGHSLSAWDVGRRRLVNARDISRLLGKELPNVMLAAEQLLLLGLQSGQLLVLHSATLLLISQLNAHTESLSSVLLLPDAEQAIGSKSFATIGQGYTDLIQPRNSRRAECFLLTWLL